MFLAQANIAPNTDVFQQKKHYKHMNALTRQSKRVGDTVSPSLSRC